jgi:hypothetical protein
MTEYERARANLIERQEAELRVFQQRLEDAVAEVCTAHRIREAVIEKRLRVIELKPRQESYTPRARRRRSPVASSRAGTNAPRQSDRH